MTFSMTMTGAFLDTTIVTDGTLKDRERRIFIRKALSAYAKVELPQYAIKEFNAGPLSHYVWLHNQFASSKSYKKAWKRLIAMSRTPRRNRISTALEALDRAKEDVETKLGYGIYQGLTRRQADAKQAEVFRLELKKTVIMGWNRVHKLARITFLLDCYETEPPEEVPPDNVMLVLGRAKCQKACALGEEFHGRQKDLVLLSNAIRNEPHKPENDRRLAAIALLQNRQSLADRDCRNLGDAVFALLAPKGFVILTTNLGDHGPLAKALGKTAARP